MASILYVDDEPTIRRAVHCWLDRRGHAIHSARSVASAKRCIKIYAFDGIFIDVWLGDGSGMDLYSWLREHHPRLTDQVVFVTGDLLMKPQMRQRLADTHRPILDKPFDLGDLDIFIQKWDTRRSRGVAEQSLSAQAEAQ